jgi:transcriptional regulator with XRE-family HTH domain
MSQLDLSSVAGVTPRHISFIETGRAAPSREMLDTLANALDMPLRDRNDLYLAAGYAAPYRELGLDDPELADARLAVERILTNHEPFPAVVMDRHWNLLQANRAARELFAAMLDLDRLPQPANVLELVFDPEGLRPHILDWDRLAPALLARARREAVGHVLDADLAARVTRLEQALDGQPVPSGRSGPLIDVAFTIDGVEHRFFSTVTTLGTPLDITLQEIRIELFHPADPDTRARYERAAGDSLHI